MRHVFNENIATHFAAFVQQKHKDGAAEGCGSQAGFVHLPLSPQFRSTLWRVASQVLLPQPRKQDFEIPVTPRGSLWVKLDEYVKVGTISSQLLDAEAGE